VAVAETLRRVAGVEARLKWPNDVLARGRKIAGILLESRAGAEGPVLVVGVGINLAQRAFPPDLAARATSIALETGRTPDRDAVLAALLEAIDAWRARLEREGFEPVRRRWLELAETIGRPVTIDGVTGIAVGLDADGALLVEDHGRLTRVVAGELAAEAPDSGGRADHAARR
jgi:BirA family biotin operon repressor/biotin-[acetyl-CoA-carboxylase] ligase